MPAIAGTTPVFAPIAPTDSESTYGATDTKYQVGGYQEWFVAEGDWTDTAKLPTARKRVGMWVRSVAMGSSKRWFQLDSLSPETWTAIDLSTLPSASATVTVFSDAATAQATVLGLTGSAIPGSIFIKGYHSLTPGQGAGLWEYVATSTRAVSLLIWPVTAGGRYEPVFSEGNVDITRAGATNQGAVEVTNAAVQACWLMAQDMTQTNNTLFIPSGDYRISDPIAQKAIGNASGYVLNGGHSKLTTSLLLGTGSGTILAGDHITIGGNSQTAKIYKVVGGISAPGTITIYPGLAADALSGAAIALRKSRMIVKGVARTGTYNDTQRMLQGSVLRPSTNVGAFVLAYDENCIQDINLVWDPLSTSGNTAAIGIGVLGSSSFYRNMIHRVSMRGCARGIFVPATINQTAPNNTIKDLYIMDASIQAVHIGMSGTVNSFDGWYIQNNGYVAGSSSTITAASYVRSGGITTVTVTVSAALPAGMIVGSWTKVTGLLPAGLNGISGYVFVSAYSDSTISFPVAFDPGATPVTLSAKTTIANVITGTSTGGPLVEFGNGFEWTCPALDIESSFVPRTVAGVANGKRGAIALLNDGTGSVGVLHMENFQPAASDMSFVVNRGTLDIRNVNITNCVVSTGFAIAMFKNEVLADNTVITPTFTVGNVGIGAISDVGGTLVLATSGAGASPVNINSASTTQTYRANGAIAWTAGDATTHQKVYNGLRAFNTRSLPRRPANRSVKNTAILWHRLVRPDMTCGSMSRHLVQLLAVARRTYLTLRRTLEGLGAFRFCASRRVVHLRSDSSGILGRPLFD